MDLQFEAVMSIKANELKELIREHVEGDGKLQVVSIDFDISTRSVGYGQGEHDIREFSEAKVKVRPVKYPVE